MIQITIYIELTVALRWQASVLYPSKTLKHADTCPKEANSYRGSAIALISVAKWDGSFQIRGPLEGMLRWAPV